MFNYFRNHAQPSPHRRTGSTPASPQSASWDFPSRQPHSEATSFPPGPTSMSGYGTPLTESPISPIPPQLPPIPRVASRNGNSTPPQSGPQLRHVTTKLPLRDDYGVSSTQESPTYSREGLPSIRRVSAEREGSYGAETHPGHRQIAPHAMPDASREQMNRPSSSRSAVSTTENSTTRHNWSLSVSPNASSTTLVNTVSSTHLPMEVQRFSSRGPPPSKEPSQKTKAKFNLLNPMNLLSRRRTSQGGESLQETAFSSHRASAVPAMRLPDDYDPRIKGAGVHDFNAPRPRRNPSTSDADLAAPSSVPEKLVVNVPKPNLDHQRQPVFVEQFESQEPAQGDAAIRRENLANMDFVKRMSKQLDESEIPTPELAIRTPPPSDLAVPSANRTPPTAERVSKETVSTADRGSLDRSTVNSSTSHDTGDTSPALSPSGSRSIRTSPGPDLAFRTSLPRHMVSNASRTSRFSFQQNESSRAQEKALEDKHKQKIGNDEAKNDGYDSRFDDLDEEDPSAYDDYDFDDGDDDIPYIGDDASDFTTSRRISTPLRAGVQEKEPAPPHLTQAQEQQPTGAPHVFEPHHTTQNTSRDMKETMDDLYFDDGMSEDDKVDVPADDARFDESTFDSMVHDSRYDMPRDRRLPADGREAPGMEQGQETHLDNSHLVHSVSSSTIPEVNLDQIPSRIPSDAENIPQQVSDSNRLHAYHSALASAANRAAEVGRFSRQPSLGASSSFYGTSTAQSELSPADSVSAHRNIYEHLDDQPVNFDDYDTDLEEDPMIAAANAEVLATEDADFYGQEFGFYGGSSGTGEMFNGGYFGNNMATTGNAIKEPNLTPITERSEFSTRNSFISIQGHGSSSALSGLPGMPWNEAASSPGLKELMTHDEDDMTLGQLLKLRRETFGGIGSRGSVGNISHEGSPTYSAGSPMYPKSSLAHASSSPHAESMLAAAFDPDTTPRRPETATSRSNSSGNVFSQEDMHQQPIPMAFKGAAPRAAQFNPPVSTDAVEAAPSRSVPFAHAANSPLVPPQVSAGANAIHSPSASASSPGRSGSPHVRVPSNIMRKPVPPAALSDIPVLSPPQPQNRRSSMTTRASQLSDYSPVSPLLEQGEIGSGFDSSTSVSPIQSPEMKSSRHFATAAALSPQSFAARAGPESYYRHTSLQKPVHEAPAPRPSTAVAPPPKPMAPYASSAHARASSLGDGRESVAYVLERAGGGGTSSSSFADTSYMQAEDRWYLERRRTTSSGEVVVVGRELVEGGRI